MCGRYGKWSRARRIAELLGLDDPPVEEAARYNIAPRTFNPIAVSRKGSAKAEFQSLEWGLLPAWAKDSQATRQVNARAEAVAEKPMFSRLLRERRGLVPADGYYEWKTTPAGKYPYWFTMKNGEPFFFAALWDRWERRGESVVTFTLLTTSTNELTEQVHDRMPVIVRQEDYEHWLDPEAQDPETIARVLRPYPAELMKTHRVSIRVNDARAEGSELIAPVNEAAEPMSGTLF